MVDLFAITYPEVKKGTLALSDGVLEIDEVVRVVAHKRIVCRGRWGGLAVYAKIFIGKEANRYALRDETGVIALRQAGINTTDLLIATETLDGAHVLVYAAIKNAQNAEVVCKQLGKNARFRLMQKLVSTVAQHHQAGLIQTDLYLKNFLVQYDSAQYDAAQNALVLSLIHICSGNAVMKDIAGLVFSTKDCGFTAEDWVLFKQHYLPQSEDFWAKVEARANQLYGKYHSDKFQKRLAGEKSAMH